MTRIPTRESPSVINRLEEEHSVWQVARTRSGRTPDDSAAARRGAERNVVCRRHPRIAPVTICDRDTTYDAVPTLAESRPRIFPGL